MSTPPNCLPLHPWAACSKSTRGTSLPRLSPSTVGSFSRRPPSYFSRHSGFKPGHYRSRWLPHQVILCRWCFAPDCFLFPAFAHYATSVHHTPYRGLTSRAALCHRSPVLLCLRFWFT